MKDHKLQGGKIQRLIDKHVNKDLLSLGQTYLPIFFEGLTFDGFAHGDPVNRFNDVAIIFNIAENQIHGAWECTTESGRYYRVFPLNSKGFALIKFGYQECWQVGYHKRQYPALAQSAAEVEVIRNTSPNGNRKTGTPDKGYFGINIHTTANNDKNLTLSSNENPFDVDKHSAGCLVLRNAEEFYHEFMPLVIANTRRTVGVLTLPSHDYVNA